MNSDQIHQLLNRDPLADAEQITGESYKEDKGTMALGVLMHLQHGEAKGQALRSASDSYFSMNLADTLALYADLGFEVVLRDEFQGRSHSDAPAPTETFTILWHPDGILATVESYNTIGRNNTKIYYNVRFNADANRYQYTSSGHFTEDGVWVGDHDARQGVRNTIERFHSASDFLPVWVERPFLWFVTYSESYVDGYDHEAITDERIGRLPQHVQDAIAGVA